MKTVAALCLAALTGCTTASKDPFASPPAPRHELKVVRTVLTINPDEPALRPSERAEDYREPIDIEWRSRAEQGMLRFFEGEGVSFVGTPGAYIFMPELNGQFLRNARHKYYLVIVQTPENLAKIERILARFRNEN